MTMNHTPLRQRLALVDRFKRVLALAMDQRDARPGASNGVEYDWVLFERGVMVDEVNAVRAELGKEPIPRGLVAQAEQQAVGHVDYHAKFALYCAEIAMDDPRWVRHGEPS